MGMFSFNCKECDHPMLSRPATDKGINEWMSDVVLLTENGSRIIGEYDGYGGVGSSGDDDDYYEGGCFVHKACWEKHGKKDYEGYGGPSDHANDQGWFFNDGDHDMIDPRIPEDEAEELLKAGQARRKKFRYDEKAQKVHEWIHDPDYRVEEGEVEAWEQRYQVRSFTDQDGKLVVYATDELEGCEHADFGTVKEAREKFKSVWNLFLKSNDCKAYVKRAEELFAEWRENRMAELRKEGRYEVSYNSIPVDSDGRQCYRTEWHVNDKLHYNTVAITDSSGNSVESTTEKELVAAQVLVLNTEWAESGCPGKEVC